MAHHAVHHWPEAIGVLVRRKHAANDPLAHRWRGAATVPLDRLPTARAALVLLVVAVPIWRNGLLIHPAALAPAAACPMLAIGWTRSSAGSLR